MNQTEFRLYYEESGTGEPLVLLHGNGENGEYFAAQRSFFEKKYRVIAVDTRGHGKSPRGTAPFTLTQFAEDLRELLDLLGLKKISLLGFSDGANIAMLFALRYQEYLNKLILDGGNLSPSGVKLTIQLPIVMGYGLVSLIGLVDKKARAKKELLRLMVKEPHIRPEDLGKLRVPTLVMAGTKDMIKESHTKKIHGSIPGSTLCIIEGSHFIAAERPEEFNRALEAFLDQ